MAFPSTRTTATTNGTAAATNPTVNLPGTLTAGDTLLMLFRKAIGAQNAPSGWTELVNSAGDNTDDTHIVAWKMVVGDEGATAAMAGGASSAKFSCAIWQVQGAADPAVTPPEAAHNDNAAAGNPADPPSLSPTGGAKDYLWFAMMSMAGEQTDPSDPTNYALDALFADSGTASTTDTNCRVNGVARQLNAASEDPGTFGNAGTGWMASTVAIHPATGGHTGTIAQTLPRPTQAASGAEAIRGTVAQTLPRLTQALAGTAILDVAGTIAQLLPKIRQAILGTSGGAASTTGGEVYFWRRRRRS